MSSYYTRRQEKIIRSVSVTLTIFTVAFFSAWVFGFIGDKLGMTGTYWAWYWFSVISGFANRLIGFFPQG